MSLFVSNYPSQRIHQHTLSSDILSGLKIFLKILTPLLVITGVKGNHLRNNPLTQNPYTLPTLTPSNATSYPYSSLGISPIDIKPISLSEDLIAFQSIERTTSSGINYYNMKVSFLNTITGDSQTVTCTSNNNLRITNAELLPKPEVLDNGNIIVGWGTTGGFDVNVLEKDSTGKWHVKCSRLISESIPQTRQPVLLGQKNGTFTVLSGIDDTTYDSVMNRYFDQNCKQISSAYEISTPKKDLTEFYAFKLENQTALLDARFLDGTQELVRFNATSGRVLSRKSQQLGAMSFPFQTDSTSFLTPKLGDINFDLQEIMLNLENIGSNTKTTDIQQSPLLVGRAYGIVNGPNQTFALMQFDGQNIEGSLLTKQGDSYGVPFSFASIMERPKPGSTSPIFLPIDTLKQSNKTLLLSYTNEGIKIQELSLILGSIQEPTGAPTRIEYPEPTQSPSKLSHSSKDNHFLLLVIICPLSTGLIAILCCGLKKNISKKTTPINSRDSNLEQNYTSNLEPRVIRQDPDPFELASAPPLVELQPQQISIEVQNSIQFAKNLTCHPIVKEVMIIEITKLQGKEKRIIKNNQQLEISEKFELQGENIEDTISFEQIRKPSFAIRTNSKKEVEYIGNIYETDTIREYLKSNTLDTTTRIPINGYLPCIEILEALQQHNASQQF